MNQIGKSKKPNGKMDKEQKEEKETERNSMKRCSTSVVTRKMPIKILKRYYFTPTRVKEIVRQYQVPVKMWTPGNCLVNISGLSAHWDVLHYVVKLNRHIL